MVGLKAFFPQPHSSPPTKPNSNLQYTTKHLELVLVEAIRRFVTDLSQTVSDVSTKCFACILKLGKDINLQVLT